jgi:hypothetical protein
MNGRFLQFALISSVSIAQSLFWKAAKCGI